MKVENIYTSAACNPTPQSLDWGNNGLLLYAAGNAVVICEKQKNGSYVAKSCNVHHAKRVNVVKWITPESNGPEDEYISGSDDSLAVVHSLASGKDVQLRGHEDGLKTLDSTYHNGQLVIATAGSSVRIWERPNDSSDASCVQKFDLRGFCFAIKVAKLKSADKVIVAYATDDCRITLMSKFQRNTQEAATYRVIHQLRGHEDWVRGLDVYQLNENDLLLASCSQDTFVRIWRISSRDTNCPQPDSENLLNEIQLEYDSVSLPVTGSKECVNLTFHLESVLQSHEGWVFGVHWVNTKSGLNLLSSSIDKSLVVWGLSNGMWMEKTRLGEVGGNTLGFLGAKFSSNGDVIVAHGHQGSLHLWNRSEKDDENWIPGIVVSGHCNAVRDLAWNSDGDYLLSVSADQTTRIHGPWLQSNANEVTWHEIARPQVHGYDMQCISVLSKHKFASGAEEKIVRIFQAPGNFISNFERICKGNTNVTAEQLESMPKGASVPSLGLSNKAVYESDDRKPDEKHVKDIYPENYFVQTILDSPPQEESLMQNTLWPETQKLYGHGYEIYSLAATPDGKWLASACKATSTEHAAIIVWDTSSWKQAQTLVSHQLTVTQMKFAPNNKYLLSVSRDRRWTLFENLSTNGPCNFQIIGTIEKSNRIHARTIWACDWAYDSSFFVTTSRDGKVIPWSEQETNSNDNQKWKHNEILDIKESVTAVACCPHSVNDKHLIALGLEKGIIHLYTYKPWLHQYTIDFGLAHHGAVKKLEFRPKHKEIEFASCGEDSFVRIYRINLEN